LKSTKACGNFATSWLLWHWNEAIPRGRRLMQSKLSALIRHESLVAERRLLRAIGRGGPPKIAQAPSQKPAVALMPPTPLQVAGVETTALPRKTRGLPAANLAQ